VKDNLEASLHVLEITQAEKYINKVSEHNEMINASFGISQYYPRYLMNCVIMTLNNHWLCSFQTDEERQQQDSTIIHKSNDSIDELAKKIARIEDMLENSRSATCIQPLYSIGLIALLRLLLHN
jgi:hypothetical protein